MSMYTPPETSVRLIEAIEKRFDEQPFYRFQMSVKGVSTMAERPCVDSSFLAALASEMFSRGWCMFPVSHTSYCFIKSDKAEGWRKISGDRMCEILAEADK
ncbi:hypothetical protein [Vibrio sp. CB1-14]|uniref:Uncharacterized protein n=1 Tax=Vibrio chaetopteri TaxID=3016528 RepID=A0AAU8BMI2_9VIBR